jgi:hypothetical protein
MIAKSTAIKDRGGKSGGRAAKAVDLTDPPPLKWSDLNYVF